MILDLEFVELHQPLFIDGMNFGLKLYADPKKNKAPIEMWYDTELRHTVIVYKQKVALIESTASKTLKNPDQLGYPVLETKQTLIRMDLPQSHPNHPMKTAQVSTPISQPPKKPGRPAKYQGDESQGE